MRSTLMLTRKLKAAVRFSIKTHEVYQKQKRKGKDVAYITHPLTVGLLLARVGASEDVIAAGILHDTIEDSVPEKKVTRAMLAGRFGDRVARIVVSVTNKPKEQASWEERRRDALARIASYPHDSLLVRAADLVSNVSELIDDYGRDGDKVFLRFSRPKEKTLMKFQALIDAVLARWPGNPFARDLRVLARGLRRIGGA